MIYYRDDPQLWECHLPWFYRHFPLKEGCTAQYRMGNIVKRYGVVIHYILRRRCVFSATGFAIRSGSYRAQKPPKAGNTKKIRKKYQIPHPGWDPENTKKITKKIQTWSFSGHFIYDFCWSFFRIFGVPPGGFGNFFVFFSSFRPWGVFVPCTSPTESQCWVLLGILGFLWQCKNLMYRQYSKKGVVDKLHAGWFINRTPGEFINCGLFIKFKGLLCPGTSKCRFVVLLKGQFRDRCIWALFSRHLGLWVRLCLENGQTRPYRRKPSLGTPRSVEILQKEEKEKN